MNFIFKYLTIMAAIFICILGCEKDENQNAKVDFSKIFYKNASPIFFNVDSIKNENIIALNRVLKYRYKIMVGDTLEVSILEFSNDIYALDYYMNSGHFQGNIPILRGNFLEQSIRADRYIFIFKHDSYRTYDRSDLENYVRKFPGFKGGFPQGFLSFPFENREKGRTSIQSRYFLGIPCNFPMMVQSYKEGNIRWNVARSSYKVEESDFLLWANALEKVSPKDLRKNSEYIYFNAGEGAIGMASLHGSGRVAVVWGYLSWGDLERKFIAASDRIFESRF